jgi:hypothetical protein
MATQEDFVLDCSVTMAWCFNDEATPYTDGGRDCLTDKRAVVPTIWPLEAANATLMGERRKRLDEARSQRFFVLLAALPIVIVDQDVTVVRYCRTPFEKEPDFKATSANYDLDKLLVQATEPA